MHKHLHPKKLLILVVLYLMLTVLPVHGQDATATTPSSESQTSAQTENTLSGITSLVLLGGFFAVLIVGGTMIMREKVSNQS